MIKKVTQHILLVEDDSNDALFFKRALTKISPSTSLTILNDGEQAVQFFTKFIDKSALSSSLLPDLVILDLKLPRRSGLEVLEWIRNQEALQRLPVLILTSSDQISDVKKAYALNANSYLVKPIGFENLVELIDMVKSYWLEINVLPSTTN